MKQKSKERGALCPLSNETHFCDVHGRQKSPEGTGLEAP